MTRRSALVTGLVLSAAAALLAGCGASVGGAAAAVGSAHISDSTLAAAVAEVQRGNGRPVDQAGAELVQTTLRRMVTETLVAQLAAEKGITVTATAVDTRIADLEAGAGGREGLEKLFLDSGLPPSHLRDYVLFEEQVKALGDALAPGADDAGKSQAVFEAAVAYGERAGVEISPRYGSWDPVELNLGPVPTDLAAPPSETAPATG